MHMTCTCGTHQGFISEVQSHSKPIAQLRAEGEAVRRQSSPEEQVMVDHWVADVEQRCGELSAVLDEKQVRNTLAIPSAQECTVVHPM